MSITEVVLMMKAVGVMS